MDIFYSYSPRKTDAHLLLAAAVEGLYSIPCPDISRDVHGKPYFPSRPDIHFSISHTDGLVMAAVGDENCGCDAQIIRWVRPGVESRICAPEELEEFTFMELWTLKESFYKFLGHTKMSFRDMVFRRKNGAVIPPDPTLHARLYTLPGYQAAAVSISPPPSGIKHLQF